MMDESIISHLFKLGFLPRQRCYIFPQKIKGRPSTALFQIIGAMGSGYNYLNPSNRKDFTSELDLLSYDFFLALFIFGLLFFSCLLRGRIVSLISSNKLIQHAV